MTFASENQRSVSDATEESFLVAYTRRCRRKKEDLSAKARALVVLYVLCVSNHAELRSITNISSLSVFAGASAISDQRQPHDLFHWFSLFCTTPSHVQTTKKPFIYRAVVYLSLSLFTSFSALVVLLLCWCSETARTFPIASSGLGISARFHSRLSTS